MQDAKLTASDGAAGDQFGFSVAVSGSTAVIGSNLDDNRGTIAVVLPILSTFATF